MKKISLSEVQNQVNEKRKTTHPSLMSLEHLSHLCNVYSIGFDLDPKESKVNPVKIAAVYKAILKQLGGDKEELENMIKFYIPIGRVVKYFIPTFTPMLLNIFFLKENLPFYRRAVKIMLSHSRILDWISLKRKMEEQGEDYADIKRHKNYTGRGEF